jgi:hypothetical protein
MRRRLMIALTCLGLGLLAAAGSAQAVVIDLGSAGRYGVAMVPGTKSNLGSAGISTVTASAPCNDAAPALADFPLGDTGLCFQGGGVLHANETFTVTWDQHRQDWQTTRDYVEQFLKNVGTDSGKLGSQYALTGQYRDAGGRAAYDSVYGGGCIDYGVTGGSACKFAGGLATGPGHDYGANGCTPTGQNIFWQDQSGVFGSPPYPPNDYCLSDAQIRSEVSAMVDDMGLIGRSQAGHTPVIVLRTPSDVVTCLDAAGKLCSANGGTTAQFCSYHSQVNVGGTAVDYIVAPWVALTGCDDLGVPPMPDSPTAQEVAINIGQRLVSPISQAHLASITDPSLNGWYALDGSEINDNGCVPFPKDLDKVSIAGTDYWLQREYNNAGAITSDPNAPKCAPLVDLGPTFVVPSPIDAGDVVAFDGSVTASTLLVQQSNFVWNFGDGTTAHGASVLHTFAKGGNYSVSLTVTDRGGNQATVRQTVTVLGSGGQVPPPPSPGKKPVTKPRLQVRLQLVPQGLKSLLRSGVALRVTSNQPAAGLSTLSISRQAARQAHIRTGRSSSVVVGRGTVAGIKNGTVRLHLHLSKQMASKLSHLRHLKLTVRLALQSAAGDHTAIDAAGSY